MKKWLTTRFLPLWAKETVLRDNQVLKARLRRRDEQNKNLKRENLQLKDQIRRLQAQLNR